MRFVNLKLLRSMSTIKNKFEGALVGALVGDCLGAPFEYDDNFVLSDVIELIDGTEEEQCFINITNITTREATGTKSSQAINITFTTNGSRHSIKLKFTDDTEMTQELADSLIEKNGFNANDLARRFVLRYKTGASLELYGANVIEVFRKLFETDFSDPLLPAKEQFGGSGSLGNGAAMRVAPVALFHVDSVTSAAKLAKETASITHTHEDGTHGAIFQCLAIRRCLINSVTDVDVFLKDFREDLIEAEVSERYIERLAVIDSLIKKQNIDKKDVVSKLGNGVKAFRSVPTALFCFLRGLSPIPGVNEQNSFRRIMEFSISLGGDTDTIASMAGAIAGANFGLDGISVGTYLSCQQIDRVIQQAEKLFNLFLVRQRGDNLSQ